MADVESVTDRMSRSLVALGAFGTAGRVHRHPERALEYVLKLRADMVARGDDRVRRVDRVIRVLQGQKPLLVGPAPPV